jgi:hypothetical protein
MREATAEIMKKRGELLAKHYGWNAKTTRPIEQVKHLTSSLTAQERAAVRELLDSSASNVDEGAKLGEGGPGARLRAREKVKE